MKFIIPALLLIAASANAQSILKFDKKFVESEDRWVAFPKDKDSTYTYGFIYIDAQAGLTLNYEGTFKIASTGEFIPTKMDSTNLKVRLEPNNVRVAFIPEEKFNELKISAVPDWLKYYKTDTASVARLYRWGFMYNGWDQCAKALTYLERAQKIDPNFKGLKVELAFSYNCLSQYEKAITVLKEALETSPKDAYINKELIYAQIKSGQLDKAAESCKKAIAICDDRSYHAENCYNLLYSYYQLKDKQNFSRWLDETRKWTSGNPQLVQSINAMENELK